jgi:hypothetical protein
LRLAAGVCGDPYQHSGVDNIFLNPRGIQATYSAGQTVTFSWWLQVCLGQGRPALGLLAQQHFDHAFQILCHSQTPSNVCIHMYGSRPACFGSNNQHLCQSRRPSNDGHSHAPLGSHFALQANHGGRIGFKLCPRRDNINQACFDQFPLTR